MSVVPIRREYYLANANQGPFMNIFSQVVPGLRDTRTPFAVGVLWAATGWMVISCSPSSDGKAAS
jgi:hypothetical protein